MTVNPISADEFDRRVIEPSEFVADTAAFVDVRLPRSAGKASYSMIGPGVAQNADQTVNLKTPHGFNIGAASMPPGVVNNQHLHFTPEVFICTAGRWRMAVGAQADQHIEIGPNTIFSVPTWVFRGFENIGDDDGWLFTVLGGDDTGGILWAPDVLEQAAETGLYLTADHEVVEADAANTPDNVLTPLSAEQLKQVDSYDDADIEARVVRPDDRQWSDHALLSSVAEGHRVEIAPVIGFGLTEDRHHRAPIANSHGFSVEWLRARAGQSIGAHSINDNQVLFLVSGQWSITLNHGAETMVRTPATGSVVSIPAGAIRDIAAVGSDNDDGGGMAEAVVVCNSDHRSRINWDPDLVVVAHQSGWALDAGGYLAPADMLGRPAC